MSEDAYAKDDGGNLRWTPSGEGGLLWAMSEDGRVLWIIDTENGEKHEYTLTTPFDRLSARHVATSRTEK